jgi:hypothetical protein
MPIVPTGKLIDVFPVAELYLYCGFRAGDDGNKPGDIVESRPWTGEIGPGERAKVVPILIQGLEKDDIFGLKNPWWDEARLPERIMIEKSRFCVPFSGLKRVYSNLRVSRCLDKDDPYSPFGTWDPDSHRWIEFDMAPFKPSIIWDKGLQRYL